MLWWEMKGFDFAKIIQMFFGGERKERGRESDL